MKKIKYISITLLLVLFSLTTKSQSIITQGTTTDNRCFDGLGSVTVNYTVTIVTSGTTASLSLTVTQPNPNVLLTLSSNSYTSTSANQVFTGSATITILNGGAFAFNALNYNIIVSTPGFSTGTSGFVKPVISPGVTCFGQTINPPDNCGCRGDQVPFYLNNFPHTGFGATYQWDFGDGSPFVYSPNGITHSYSSSGTYTVVLTITKPGCTPKIISYVVTINQCDCFNCVTSFHPSSGEKYVLSLWVKEDVPNQVKSYLNPAISLDFSNPVAGTILGPFIPKGNIIDGWQKIEEVITIPANSWSVDFNLINRGNNNVYFDDIRMHPFNSSMKSYVYDPVTLKLWAELDDNNYATFYQYDEEGKLIRIKKETSRGVQTIQESREGSYKKEKIFNTTLNDEDSSN